MSSASAGVGTPPDQKNASTRPARSAPMEASSPSRVIRGGRRSRAAASTRVAVTAVPEPSTPMDTARPASPPTAVISESVPTTRCT